jgi:hypothetical protein
MARAFLAKGLWLSLGLAAVTVPVASTVVTNDTAVAANQTFDYVIVGAGLTGLTVGNKVRSARASTDRVTSDASVAERQGTLRPHH